MRKILHGINILDMTEGVAGPYATTFLGDMGASVVKVERPEGEWGRGPEAPLKPAFIGQNRNKRNICLDLQHQKARKVIERLILRSDVIISNYRKGVMDRMGFGFQDCLKINPKIIYCTISAYGQKGVYSSLPASDTIIQAISGIMESIGEVDGPPMRVSFPLIDIYTASLAAQGILLGLFARQQQKVGMWIDISLFNAAMVLQTQALADFLINGDLPKRCGNQNPAISPGGAFKTLDGKFISVAVLRESQWKRFCNTLGCSYLFSDERYKNNEGRLANRESLNKILTPIFLTKAQEEWVALLTQEDILCAPINTFVDVFENQALCESLSLMNFEVMGKRVRTAGNPIEIDGEYAVAKRPSCLKGEHTDEILRELNFNENEIETMLNEGISHRI